MPLTRRALGSVLDAAWLRRQFTRDSEIAQDLRHITRIGARSPLMMSLVVAVLALGIGATTAVFSAVEAMFLRPLPYASAERIVMLWQKTLKAASADDDVAPANFLDWRAQLTSGFEAIAAAEPFSRDYTGAGEPEIFAGARVTERFFDILRVEPLLGRLFTQDDYRQRRNVVVLSSGRLAAAVRRRSRASSAGRSGSMASPSISSASCRSRSCLGCWGRRSTPTPRNTRSRTTSSGHAAAGTGRSSPGCARVRRWRRPRRSWMRYPRRSPRHTLERTARCAAGSCRCEHTWPADSIARCCCSASARS